MMEEIISRFKGVSAALALLGQKQRVMAAYADQTLLNHLLDRDTDAGLCASQPGGDIHGPHDQILALKRQYGVQISIYGDTVQHHIRPFRFIPHLWSFRGMKSGYSQ